MPMTPTVTVTGSPRLLLARCDADKPLPSPAPKGCSRKRGTGDVAPIAVEKAEDDGHNQAPDTEQPGSLRPLESRRVGGRTRAVAAQQHQRPDCGGADQRDGEQHPRDDGEEVHARTLIAVLHHGGSSTSSTVVLIVPVALILPAVLVVLLALTCCRSSSAS